MYVVRKGRAAIEMRTSGSHLRTALTDKIIGHCITQIFRNQKGVLSSNGEENGKMPPGTYGNGGSSVAR